MMGVTHVWVGTMSAVILTGAASPAECLASLIGGSLGGIICDIDLGKRQHSSDTTQAMVLAGTITLGCLTVDQFLGQGLIRNMRNGMPMEYAAGLLGLVLLSIWGRQQPHRGGTHSLLAIALFGACVDLVCGLVSRPFLIGMGSHLVLDILNRRPLQLFYPLHGRWCLGLCKVDDRFDRMMQTIGLLGTLFGVGIRVGSMV